MTPLKITDKSVGRNPPLWMTSLRLEASRRFPELRALSLLLYLMSRRFPLRHSFALPFSTLCEISHSAFITSGSTAFRILRRSFGFAFLRTYSICRHFINRFISQIINISVGRTTTTIHHAVIFVENICAKA